MQSDQNANLVEGRVTLLGDASSALTPLPGQATSTAMVGAYVLAGELAAARCDYRTAFARYEAEVRPFVEHNQNIVHNAKKSGGSHDLGGGR